MKQKAYILVILAGILAGTGGIFIKFMSLSPTAIVWLRTTVPLIVVGLWLVTNGFSFFKKAPKKMLLASSLNALRMYFFVVAYIYTSVGNAAILFYSYPIFISILENLYLKEKGNKKQFVLLLMAFAGLIIAYSDKPFSFADEDFIGMGAAIISSFVYSITVILFKSEAPNFHRFEMVFYQNFAGSLLFFPAILLSLDALNLKEISLGIGYGLVIGVVVFSLFFQSIKSLKASTASTIMYLEVVSAILLSYFFFGDKLSLNMLLGGSLIVISSFMITRK